MPIVFVFANLGKDMNLNSLLNYSIVLVACMLDDFVCMQVQLRMLA